MSKKQGVFLVVLLFIASMLAACIASTLDDPASPGSEVGETLTELQVCGSSTGFGSWPLVYAAHTGVFQKYGLQVEYQTVRSGATLSILDPRRASPQELARWLTSQEVNFLRLPSSLLRMVLDNIPRDVLFPALRFVQPTQRLYHSDVARLWLHLPRDAAVMHRFSSTETGTITTINLQREQVGDENIVPVGYPVPGVEVYLVDEDGSRVPDGEIGEIVARGRYLPISYWRRPDLSAKKFQLDPSDSQYRIVKLGDLGRIRPDGCLELIGRRDHMVKIRGHRIELDEVEIALEQLAEIGRAIAVVHPDPFGDQTVIAYVEPAGPNKIDIGSLRLSLKHVLPDAMIPTKIVQVDVLPLLSNGKVDRSALPHPGRNRPDLDTPFVAPRTPAEIRVAAIWADLLDIDQIGMHDNFLEVGGHSLLAARIVSRILREFRVDLPLSLLFESPTVAEMALMITQQQAVQLDHETVERLLNELDNQPGTG